MEKEVSACSVFVCAIDCNSMCWDTALFLDIWCRGGQRKKEKHSMANAGT